MFIFVHRQTAHLNLFSFCETQLPVGKSSCIVPLGPGPGLSGCRAAAVFVTQIIPNRALLQEAACREQRQQGDPGAGDGSFRLFHADGKTLLSIVYSSLFSLLSFLCKCCAVKKLFCVDCFSR